MARTRAVGNGPAPVSRTDRHPRNSNTSASVITNLPEGLVNAWAAEGGDDDDVAAADRNEGVRRREDEEEEEEEEVNYEAILKNKSKTEILELLKDSNKRLKQATAEKENELENVNKTMTKLAETRQQLDSLQKQMSEEVSGLTTATEVAALSEDFSGDNKKLLCGLFRTVIFKKHKITTARSFENGEIQMTLQSHLGGAYTTAEMLAAHRDSLVRLVNHDLTQRRNHVNNMIMKEWTGTSITVQVLDVR